MIRKANVQIGAYRYTVYNDRSLECANSTNEEKTKIRRTSVRNNSIAGQEPKSGEITICTYNILPLMNAIPISHTIVLQSLFDMTSSSKVVEQMSV